MSMSGFIAALRKTDKAWEKSFERLICFNKMWPHGIQRTLYAKTLGFFVCVCASYQNASPVLAITGQSMWSGLGLILTPHSVTLLKPPKWPHFLLSSSPHPS